MSKISPRDMDFLEIYKGMGIQICYLFEEELKENPELVRRAYEKCKSILGIEGDSSLKSDGFPFGMNSFPAEEAKANMRLIKDAVESLDGEGGYNPGMVAQAIAGIFQYSKITEYLHEKRIGLFSTD